MTEEENQAGENGAEAGEKPVKKKTSVKVVRRVKSKKSEKGERPELAPPPATIDEQQPVGEAAAESGSGSASASSPAASGSTTPINGRFLYFCA